MNQGTRKRILRLMLAWMLVVSFIGGTQAFAAASSSTLVPERQSFFSNPRGIAVDSTGNIYVADTSNNRIQKFNSTGTLLATWGTAGSGQGQFSNPSGIAVDNSTGNVYVVDTSNNRIQVFSATGTYLTQWGTTGSGDGQFSAPSGVVVDSMRDVYVVDTSNNRIQKFRYTGDYLTQWGITGSGDGQFSTPSGVAVDSTGYVYVTDSSNRRVQKFSSTGTYVTQWGTAGNGNGQFSNPSGIAVDSTGNVYVADALPNNRIQKFSSTGTYLTQWGTAGSGDGQFNTPAGIAVDSAGNVYVADRGNNRMQKFNSTGAFLASWQTTGSGNGQLNSPNGVAVDSEGNIYVADTSNNRIQKFGSAGTFVTKWGSTGSGDGQFSAPFGVAVDSGGNIYVSDAYNHRIQKFNSTGAFVTKWGTAGSGAGQFNTPTGIAVDSGGNIYVADTYNSRIQKFSPAGGFVASWGVGGSGDGQFNMPFGVAVDSMGNIYVADTYNHRIQKLDSTGAFVTKWGSGGSGDGQFDTPAGIAVDSGGNIYVSDSYNHRVQKFDSAGTFIAKWGSNGNGDGQFNGPCGIAADSWGNIYVADTDNHRIQVTNSDAGLTSVSAKTINAGPEAGTDTAPKTASVNVANITATVASGDIAGHGAGATVTFYGTDSGFTTPETGSVSLTAGGATTVYIKVTAQDMITVRYYAVTINREAAPGAPSITTHPSDQTVTAGQTATFTVAASGTAPLSYQWKNDGVDIIGAASSTLTITNVQASDAGSYTCYVSNGAGNITSNAATLTVNPAPVAPAITIATQPAALTNVTESSISGSLTVAAAVHPSGTPAYEWFSCDDTIHTNPVTTSVTANTFTIPTTLTAGSYYYYCEVRAAGATPVNSNVATVVVNSAPSGTAPAVISINPISLDLGGTNTATIQIKLGQSGGNPNVFAGKASVTTTGGAISVTPATPADLTADGSITVTGISTGTATVSIGFSGGDVAFGDTKYDRIITVNVTDSSISPPSDAKDVTGVATPGGASISGAAITATVANGVTSQAIALSVSANASWKLYSDAACLNEIIDKTMVLSVGPNAAYVQVTAENGTTKVYTLTITRQDRAIASLAADINAVSGLIADVSGSTVTVTGTAMVTTTSGAALALEIPSDVKVLWKASFAGGGSNYLLELTGDGTFEVAAGADISTACQGAIYCSGGKGDLNVTGGKVSTTAGSGYAIGIAGDWLLTMTGGEASTNAAGSCAIFARNSVVITGGTVSATGTGGFQLYMSQTSVYRGSVLDPGKIMYHTSGVFADVSIDAAVTQAQPGTSTGLTVTGHNLSTGDRVTAVWAVQNGVSGVNISYYSAKDTTNAVETWFLAVPGVTVTTTTTYTVTSSPLTGGTITASPTSATSGSAINLTITPNAGMRLQAGSLKYNDGTTDHPISGTSFTMPAANVIVSAVFENVPQNTYTVSIGTLIGGIITSSPISATPGSAITLTVTPDAGKQLQAGSLKYNDGSDHTITGTSFTMPSANVTVTAEFEVAPPTPPAPPIVVVGVDGVSLNKTFTGLSVGQAEQLTATITPANATFNTVTWSVFSQSGSNVVTLSPIGLVKAVNPGTAVIRVTSNADPTKFAECNVTVVSVDNTALVTAITDAEKLLSSKTIGTEVGNVSQQAHDAYNTAIISATVVKNNASATQAEIDAALTALATATTTFNKAVIAVGDKTALTIAITNATTLLGSKTVGTAVGNVSQADHDAYNSAIMNATEVKNNASVTQVQVDAAVTALATATKAFNDAIILKNSIISFTVPRQVGSSTIDSTNHTVTFHMANGSSVTRIAPTIILSAGATISPRSRVAKNFTNPVIYTVTAQDGTIQTWTVNCIVDSKSSAKDITGFTVPRQVGSSTIDSTNHTVTFHMANGRSVTRIAPTITLSAKATISSKSRVVKNFTNPVIYTVTAQDGTIQTWTVNCIVNSNS